MPNNFSVESIANEEEAVLTDEFNFMQGAPGNSQQKQRRGGNKIGSIFCSKKDSINVSQIFHESSSFVLGKHK